MTNGRHIGVLFNRKSGKIVNVYEDKFGSAFLRMFAMGNNISATRDFIIFNMDGIVTDYFEGKKNDMPNICKDMIGKKVEDFGFSLADFE